MTGESENIDAPEPAPTPSPEAVAKVIKRYSNRKLYDTARSKYVTLDEIAKMIKAGEEVRIVDNKTSRDLTAVTLAQIIYEEEKQKNRMPLPMLRRLVQSGGGAIEEFFDRSVKAPVAEMKSSAEKSLEEIRQSAVHLRDAATKSFTEWTETARRVFLKSESEKVAKKVDDAVKKLDQAIEEVERKIDAQLRESRIDEPRAVDPILEHLQKRVRDLADKLALEPRPEPRSRTSEPPNGPVL